jgi:hypothetical protein
VTGPILTDREQDAIRASVQRNGGSPDDVARVIAWAAEARCGASVLEGLLAGLVCAVIPADPDADLQFTIDPHHVSRVATAGGAS